MTSNSNKFHRFWDELKRRKVFGVLATYAATAYIILEVINNLSDPLHLPEWIPTLLVLLLIAGLPVAVILSWIFDFTPQGIKKTVPLKDSEREEIVSQPLKRKLKLSYVLNAVLFIVVIVLASREIFRKDPIERLRSSDKKISVTVMPFRNLTKDTVLTNWQEWIQTDIISYLSESGELEVRDQQATNELLRTKGINEYATISPGLAGLLSKEMGTTLFIQGTLQKAGSIIQVAAQISDTKTKKVLKPFEIALSYNDTVVFEITDSLRRKINDFLLLTKLLKENPGYGSNLTQSPEALKYYIMGNNSARRGERRAAYDFYSKALRADSGFFWAAFRIERVCPSFEEHLFWLERNYKIRDVMPDYERLFATWSYAYSFESPEDRLSYMLQRRELVGSTLGSMGTLSDLGIAYTQAGQPLKAIPVYEEYLKIARRMGKEFLNAKFIYENLGYAYHSTDQEKKALKVSRKGRRYCPEVPDFILFEAGHSYNLNRTARGKHLLEKYFTKQKESLKKNNQNYTEANMAEDKGWFFGLQNMRDSSDYYFNKSLDMAGPDYNYADLNRITLGLMHKDGIMDLDKYIKYVDILIESVKNNKYQRFEYLGRKGRAYLVNGRYQEALDIFQNVYDESPYKLYYMKKNLEDVKKAIEEQKGN